jgi:hypothetical protein
MPFLRNRVFKRGDPPGRTVRTAVAAAASRDYRPLPASPTITRLAGNDVRALHRHVGRSAPWSWACRRARAHTTHSSRYDRAGRHSAHGGTRPILNPWSRLHGRSGRAPGRDGRVLRPVDIRHATTPAPCLRPLPSLPALGVPGGGHEHDSRRGTRSRRRYRGRRHALPLAGGGARSVRLATTGRTRHCGRGSGLARRQARRPFESAAGTVDAQLTRPAHRAQIAAITRRSLRLDTTSFRCPAQSRRGRRRPGRDDRVIENRRPGFPGAAARNVTVGQRPVLSARRDLPPVQGPGRTRPAGHRSSRCGDSARMAPRRRCPRSREAGPCTTSGRR